MSASDLPCAFKISIRSIFYGARTGHDDCVMSLALACWNLPTNPLPLPGSVRYLTRTQDKQTEQTSYE